MKNKFLVLFLFIFSFIVVQAKEYKISSAAELSSLQLTAGDKVILIDGVWKDQQIIFKATGTETAPVILTTEKPGTTKLSGNSTLKVDGRWLIVDGLFFTDGYSAKGDVIVVSDKSSYCRLTNTAIVNYNHPDKKFDYKWLSLYGHHNRVDHCWLEGKTHQGTTLVVWLSDKPNYHRIDHNYFGQRPDLGVNGGETIRIGTSTWSMYDSYTTVGNNIFEHCNGEIECISNKSCKNTLRNNLFYECSATLTLRHGNGSDVYGNVFLGNKKPDTGGIRIIGEDHKVHENYFQDLTGTGLMAAVSIMDGLPNPELTSHWQVKNAKIYKNTIINCKQSLSIGSGRNKDRYLPALNTSFTDNIISTPYQAVYWEDDSVKIKFEDNIIDKATDANKAEGFKVKKLSLKKNSRGMYEIEGRKVNAFWQKEDAGPVWRKASKAFAVKSSD